MPGLVTALAIAMLTDRALLVADGDASADLFASITPEFDLNGTAGRLQAVTSVPECRHVRAPRHRRPAPASVGCFCYAAVALFEAAVTQWSSSPLLSRDASSACARRVGTPARSCICSCAKFRSIMDLRRMRLTAK